MKERHTNHLIHETSPYLLQHAHNPVNWYAWGEEALEKSKKEDKPILVSIGYSACHWCHVMERESFENDEVAEIMNRCFINIKIDREERPDLDHIYMDAVQAITGSGGWPLNVFLTPALKPFFGGTYFPPMRAFNRSSWKEVLTAVAKAYKERKNEIEAQAETLTLHLLAANNFGAARALTSTPGIESVQNVTINLLKAADTEWGGFGQAPKFPQTFSILYLLRHFHFTGDETSLKQALLSADKMMMGGIYDHLGGGFARYSTDKRWQIPHFEKMLYDNALLIEAFTEAYQLTKKEKYATVIKETFRFIKNEMTSDQGGFFSALDADSEGEEGKYYIWTKKEVDDLLGKDAELFCSAFNISDAGNWEDANILWMPHSLETIADKYGLSKKETVTRLEKSRQVLFEKRQKRPRPSLDDKILLGWNSLMVKSLCKAYAALGEVEYLLAAEKNILFLEKNLQRENVSFQHSWNKVMSKQEAFLDDYAALIQGYIYLHQVTSNTDYLFKAKLFTEKVIEGFSDEEHILFYFTAQNQSDVPIRKKEIYDGATPSGNALMAENLYLLSLFFDNTAWRERSEKMLGFIKDIAEKYPASFGFWNLVMQSFIFGIKEIAVIGKNYSKIYKKILSEYLPLKLIQAASAGNDFWPLLKDKVVPFNQTKIYICENYQCLEPVKSFEEFKFQMLKTFLTKNPQKQNNLSE